MFQVLLPQQRQQLQPQPGSKQRNRQPHGIMKKLSNGKEFQLGLLRFPNIDLLPKYFKLLQSGILGNTIVKCNCNFSDAIMYSVMGILFFFGFICLAKSHLINCCSAKKTVAERNEEIKQRNKKLEEA